MNKKNKILIIEDNPHDLEFILHELDKSEMRFESIIVQNEPEYIEALKRSVPDIILSDYSLPSFDGLRAFEIAEKLIPDTPFILVSGTIGEEKAVELIKKGITDYVLKDKLFSLIPKIIRALKETEEKKQKTITDEKLYKANNLYAFISQVNQNIIRVTDETTLFRNSCRLAIEYGKFEMAWIGLFDHVEKTVVIVEQFGFVNNSPELSNTIPYEDEGPQSHVLQTGSYFIVITFKLITRCKTGSFLV